MTKLITFKAPCQNIIGKKIVFSFKQNPVNYY